MTQMEAVKAYKAAEALYQQRLDWKVAKRISKIVEKLRPAFLFQVEQESLIFDDYPKLDRATGRISFKTPEEKAEAERQVKEIDTKIKELGATDAEIDLTPYDFPEDAKCEITGEQVDALKGIINFPE